MKRKLNIKFLAILLIATFAIGLAFHLQHRRQVYRSVDAYLRRVNEAENLGNYKKAAHNLRIYLTLRPNDLDATARYAFMISRDEAKAGRADLENAARMLEMLLVRKHENPAIQRRLVQIYAQLRLYTEARAHLTRLLELSPQDGELQYQMGEILEGMNDYVEATKYYELARQFAPNKLEAYSRLARLLRTQLRAPNRADVVMDVAQGPAEGIIAKNPNVAKAYIERGRYRFEFGLPGAAEDAARGLELSPDEVVGRLLAAEIALRIKPEPDLKSARAHLAHAIARHAEDPRVYQAAAEVELRAKDFEAAKAKLEQGVKTLPDNYFLQWSLLDLKIQAKQLDGVAEKIAELRRQGISREMLQYLEAESLFAQNQWSEAAKVYESVAQFLVTNRNWETLAKRTYVSLGECYDRLGNADQRYLAYQRAVKITPLTGFDDLAMVARTGLASSLIALGRVDQAIDEYRKVLVLPDATEQARVSLARLLIFRNLRMPEARRNWDEVRALLKTAAEAMPNSGEVTILRAESLAAQRQLDPARKLLEEARDKHPDQVELWVALAALATRQQRTEEVLPILEAAEKRLGNRIEIRTARAKFWGGRGGPQATAALTALANDLQTLSPTDRILLVRELAEAHLRLGEIKEAKSLWFALTREQPDNLQIRLLLFDASTWGENETEMEDALAEIRRIEGEDGTLWRYGRAYLLIKSAVDNKAEGLTKARELLSTIIVRRPAWARAFLSLAEVDDRQGNLVSALKNYQRAIDLGDRSPQAIRRTVQLLYQVRRYGQADQVIRQLQDEMPLSSEMQRLAADVSLQTQDYARALELARKAVSSDSANYRDHVWLGQLLWSVSRKDEKDGNLVQAKSRRAEAERSLRRAVELGNDKAETWLTLIQFLSAVNNLPAAEKAIADAEKVIPEDERALPLAVANESIGRTQRAEILYKEAIERHPDDPAAVQGLANFYVKLNRIQDDAKPLLNRLIELKAKAPEDARWAKRILALALSLEGKEQLSLKALAMLDTPDDQGIGSSESNIDDLRAKAVVYAAQRNRDRRREAIRILESIVRQETPGIEDRILLAELYQADGNWTKARDQYRAALIEDRNNQTALVSYARALIRRKETDEARKLVDRLRPMIPGSSALAELETRLAALEGKPDRATMIMREFVRGKDALLPPASGLLEELGIFLAAEEFYRLHAAQPGQPVNTLILAEYLGRRGRTREALDLCDRAWATCSDIQVANSSLRILFAANLSEEDTRRVADRIEAASKAAPDQVSLSFALANARMLQGRNEEAEAIFRRIFERNKTNASPLNNLAWLLAMRDGKASEALETIDRAIAINGASPEYLDTRGMIHLAMGRGDLATKELEDSIAVAPGPDNYFHLAQAYLVAKRNREAGEALQEARNLGLKPEMLHPFERRAYDQLVASLATK
jgi:tetratricopeptide (TPR) repeat protein